MLAVLLVAVAAWASTSIISQNPVPPLFVMTRSSSILDLDALGPDETVLFCPANHAPPFRVAPYPGAPGYEAVASCLAPPEVRARSEGVIAVRR